jgi:hypothetical protein
MQRRAPRDDRSSEPFLQRIERAAGEVNPYLMILIIGLAALYLVCFVSLAPQLAATRQPAGTPSAQNHAQVNLDH